MEEQRSVVDSGAGLEAGIRQLHGYLPASVFVALGASHHRVMRAATKNLIRSKLVGPSRRVFLHVGDALEKIDLIRLRKRGQ